MSANLWTASLRRLLADLGIGGTSWTGTRTSGDGRSGPVSTSNLSAVTLYVFFELPSALALALGGAQVPKGTWWGVAAAGTDLQVGDVRTSVSTSSYSFRVASADTMAGIILCRLERV